ncbi:MAG: hypothetical protein LC808_01980, partial [Actinobacteria bacterium]|nr:hypothetical protein [Actinomycetota bacterium]
NLHDPASATVRISTLSPTPSHELGNGQIPVKTYRTVLGDYRTRLEAKSLAPEGTLCRPSSVGLLQRRPVTAANALVRIGKEADRVDLMEADLLDFDEAVTVYQTEGEELQHAMAALAPLSSRELARVVGKDRRTIDRIRAGAQPRPQLRSQLLSLAHGSRHGPLDHRDQDNQRQEGAR